MPATVETKRRADLVCDTPQVSCSRQESSVQKPSEGACVTDPQPQFGCALGGCLRKRILIVDDHPMVREGMARVIEQQPDLICCGQAGSAEEAVGLLSKLSPDLVIVDITLPGRSGFELIKDLQAMQPDLPVLVFSMHDELFYAERALRSGAKGYVNKQAGAERMTAAIRQVLAGVPAFSPEITNRILQNLSVHHQHHAVSAIEQLTDREFEVYELIGQGKNTKEIAAQLRVCEKTVAVHRDNIRQKFQLGSAAELMRHAVRWVESRSM